MENIDIKIEATKNNIKLYEVAKQLGIAESTFHRHMRFQLSEAERQKVLNAIAEIVAARQR